MRHLKSYTKELKLDHTPALFVATRYAKEYHEATELYDRTLPGVWSSKEPSTWIPRGSLATGQSIHYALEMFQKYAQEAMEHGSTLDLFTQEVKQWNGVIEKEPAS